MKVENNEQNEIETNSENPIIETEGSEYESIAQTPQERERLFRLYEIFVKINKRLSCQK